MPLLLQARLDQQCLLCAAATGLGWSYAKCPRLQQEWSLPVQGRGKVGVEMRAEEGKTSGGEGGDGRKGSRHLCVWEAEVVWGGGEEKGVIGVA